MRLRSPRAPQRAGRRRRRSWQRLRPRHERPPVLALNMLLLGLDEGAYLLKAISSVRSTELEQAMLLLPFESACALLERLLPLAKRPAH